MNRIAMFPGSFDPPTNGHYDLIVRASKLFDELHIVIANNSKKDYFYSVEEREKMMKFLVASLDTVYVSCWDGLIAHYAQKHHVHVFIRGIRPAFDFQYEFEIATVNHILASNIETVFFASSIENSIIRSSTVREVARLGGDISSMVPVQIKHYMQKNNKCT